METDIDISPNAVLKVVQEKRMRMLLDVEKIEKDKRYLMNELAETAVAVLKIETDKEIATDEKEAALATAKAISSITFNPYHKDFIKDRESAVIDPEIPKVETLPGETSRDLETFEYSDFIEKK